MSGEQLLLDSNVVIDLSKGLLKADRLFLPNKRYLISVITRMETLGFDFQEPREEAFIHDLLDQFEVLYIDKQCADEVIRTRKSLKIKLPDAIIAASAKVHGCDLMTHNIDDFKNVEGLTIINPYEL